MAALDQVIGNALNDALFPNAASGTVTIGAVTLTLPFQVRFQSTRGVAGTNGTNITGTATTGLNGKVATASASVANVPTKTNDSVISITTTASGTWNGIEIWDATGTPKRVIFAPTTDLGKTFVSGDILSIPINQLSATST
jgi:hypothetical protein